MSHRSALFGPLAAVAAVAAALVVAADTPVGVQLELGTRAKTRVRCEFEFEFESPLCNRSSPSDLRHSGVAERFVVTIAVRVAASSSSSSRSRLAVCSLQLGLRSPEEDEDGDERVSLERGALRGRAGCGGLSRKLRPAHRSMAVLQWHRTGCVIVLPAGRSSAHVIASLAKRPAESRQRAARDFPTGRQQ